MHNKPGNKENKKRFSAAEQRPFGSLGGFSHNAEPDILIRASLCTLEAQNARIRFFSIKNAHSAGTGSSVPFLQAVGSEAILCLALCANRRIAHIDFKRRKPSIDRKKKICRAETGAYTSRFFEKKATKKSKGNESQKHNSCVERNSMEGNSTDQKLQQYIN